MHIKELPPGQVLERLKDVGVTQATIGRRVGVTQSFVSRVISGYAVRRPSKASEKVWRAIEKAVNGTNP